MKLKSGLNYVADLERRHNLSAEVRSCGDHCEKLPFTEKDPYENCKVPPRSGAGMSGKGGRGAGQGARSNRGPGAETD